MNKKTITKFNRCNSFNLTENIHIYLIGIGGVGMGAIAMLLKNRGCNVTGSDVYANVVTNSLSNVGVEVDFQQDGGKIDNTVDLVVVSAAIQDDNGDFLRSKELGIKIVKYSELLGMLMNGKNGIAVSGTHGKTTTSAMISFVLKSAGLDPECVVGGELSALNNIPYSGKGDLLVVEACEYDRTFLRLSPQIGVITNIDEDHLDYYKSFKLLQSAFYEFGLTVADDGLLVINGQDYNTTEALGKLECKVETYGINDFLSRCNTWEATKPVWEGGNNSFDVYYKGVFFGKFNLVVPGVHNVMNALASIAVCNNVGVDADAMADALSIFNGVDRRFQVLSRENDITIIDDYAHHPTAIETTLGVVKETFPNKKIWCLFQPHQFSRTKLLFNDFVHSFGQADKIILTEIYQARDTAEDIKSVSSLDVVLGLEGLGLDAAFMPDQQEIVNMLAKNLSGGDVFITMGAGDIWKVADKVKERLTGFNMACNSACGLDEYLIEPCVN